MNPIILPLALGKHTRLFNFDMATVLGIRKTEFKPDNPT